MSLVGFFLSNNLISLRDDEPFDVPFRCLYAADFDNVMMAGGATSRYRWSRSFNVDRDLTGWVERTESHYRGGFGESGDELRASWNYKWPDLMRRRVLIQDYKFISKSKIKVGGDNVDV